MNAAKFELVVKVRPNQSHGYPKRCRGGSTGTRRVKKSTVRYAASLLSRKVLKTWPDAVEGGGE